MIKISIVGCTGYAGEELVRLAAGHPQINIVHLVSKSFAGSKFSDVYPSYKGKVDMVLEALDVQQLASDSDVVFTALPHGASAEIGAQLFNSGVKVIDLSGDFRYDNIDVYEAWYNIEHKAKALNDQAVYGLSEIYASEVSNAGLIGNPGCYTTTAIVPLYPLIKEKIIQPDGIIIDAKSGVSGAGRKETLTLSFCETHESFKAYSVTGHRHTSEIEQELSKAAGKDVMVSFTPHLLPIKRGILATMYCTLNGDVSRDDVLAAYAGYHEKPFIHVMKKGLPEIKHVAGSNNVFVGFEIEKRTGRLIVVSALDNLVKGAAGQAIQNMNLMFQLDETEGLPLVGTYL